MRYIKFYILILILTEPRRVARADWCRAHDRRHWGMQRWRQVIFSDESRFNLYRSDGRRRVYRRRGERYASACVNEVDRFVCRGVMM